MTSDEFRANTHRVGRMRELLNDPTLAQALVCVKDAEMPEDAPSHSDAITSVRLLSQKAGWHGAINMLLTLAEPLPAMPEEETATFGVDISKFKPQPA